MCAKQGDGEERPEAYCNTVRTPRSQATPLYAKSASGVAGSAGSRLVRRIDSGKNSFELFDNRGFGL